MSAALLERLRADAGRLDELDAPSAPGVYAWFVDDVASLPALPVEPTEPLYVGVSSDLSVRQQDTHSRWGRTGFSTLRRSLGALLKDQLELEPLPRGTGPSESNFRSYRFDDAGEEALSAWMLEHLRVSVVACPDPERVESELVALARPPLNLTGWSNPHAPKIKALRKACVEAARRNHPR